VGRTDLRRDRDPDGNRALPPGGTVASGRLPEGEGTERTAPRVHVPEGEAAARLDRASQGEDPASGHVLDGEGAAEADRPGDDRRRFFEAVWSLVREVPPGRVTTYGWLARRLGRPQHARLVGYAMYGVLDDDVPCHRVINSQGRLSGAPHFGPPGQRAMLEAEGVVFRPNGGVDLRRYLWRPDEPAVIEVGPDGPDGE
jgi:methylated-DNA-protein-cysteine methyltransferase related protein